MKTSQSESPSERTNPRALKFIWLLGTVIIIAATIIFGGKVVNLEDEIEKAQAELDTIEYKFSIDDQRMSQLERDQLAFKSALYTRSIIEHLAPEDTELIANLDEDFKNSLWAATGRPRFKHSKSKDVVEMGNYLITELEWFTNYMKDSFKDRRELRVAVKTLTSEKKSWQQWGLRAQIFGLILISFAEFWKRTS